MKKSIFLMLSIFSFSGFAFAEKLEPRDVKQRIESIAAVIARVSDVWARDHRYDGLHKELASKYSDTPPLEQFKSGDQWLVVISSNTTAYSGIFKGHAPVSFGVSVGDIIEMTVSRKASKYEELNRVKRVVCKASDGDYAACVEKNPLAWIDANGNPIQQFKDPDGSLIKQ